MADTRTFSNYAQSLPVGTSQYLVGANDRRVPRTSEGLPAGGTTGQAMVKLSDENYDAGWENMPDISGKANINSPTFTGVPAAPTAAPGTNTTQLATTAFVGAAIEAIPSGGDVTGPAGATAGNFPALDATGKVLSDSGKNPADFATSTQGAKADSALQAADLAPTIHAASSKATPVDADELGLVDSAASNALKKLTWANVKATIRTYLLGIANLWTKTQRAQVVEVDSGTTITLDLDLGQVFRIKSPGLSHNATIQLANANNHVGAKFQLTGYQNAGGNTLAYGSGLVSIGGATAPAIPAGAGAKFRMDGDIVASGEYQFNTRGVGV